MIFNKKLLLSAAAISAGFALPALADGQCMGGPCAGSGSMSGFSVGLQGGSGGAFNALGTGEDLHGTDTYAKGMKMGQTDMGFQFTDPNFCEQGADCPESDAELMVNFDSFEHVGTESGAATDLSGNRVTSGQQLSAESGGGFTISDGQRTTGLSVMGKVALGSQSTGYGAGDEVSTETYNTATGGAMSNFSLANASGECILCEEVQGSGGIYGTATNGGTVTATSHTPGTIAKASNMNFTQMQGGFNADFFSGSITNGDH